MLAFVAGNPDEQFARQLLTDWLLRRDLDTVRAQMAPDFFIKPGLRDPDVWPKALRSSAKPRNSQLGSPLRHPRRAFLKHRSNP